MVDTQAFVVLAAGAEWPTDWEFNPGSGLREPVKISPVALVSDAIFEFRREGVRHTKIKVGLNRRSELLGLLGSRECTVEGGVRLVGLDVEWIGGDSIELE